METYLRRTVLTGIFLVPFIPFLVSGSFFFPFIVVKAFAWRIIIEVVFVAWLLLALLNERYRPKKSCLLYTVFAFLIVTGLATIFSVEPLKSFWSNFERMEGYIAMLHLGAFFLVASSVLDERLWQKWWKTTLVASALMAGYALFQVLGVISPNQAGNRVDGTFGNTIYLAVYMLFHIFIALFYMWREWRNSAMRLVYGLLIVFQLYILYHTATRGAILGLLGGLLVVAGLNLFNKDTEARLARRASAGLLTALVVFVSLFFVFKDSSFVISNPVLSRFSSLTTEELKTQGRYFVWPIAFEGFKERPILGWGQDNFIYVFQKHYTPDMYHLEPWFDRAHNIFLDWMVAGGLVGLLTYLSLYAVLLWLLWSKTREMSYAEKSIITGLVSAYFFHNFFVFDHLVSYILFFALLAYIHSRTATTPLWQKSLSEEKVNNILLPLATIALVFVLFFVNLKPILGNTRLLSALFHLQMNPVDGALVAEKFEGAYNSSPLGRVEVTEHLSRNIPAILNSNMPSEDKNAFYAFTRDRVVAQAERSPGDARVQLMAGSFLSTTGSLDDALSYLSRARELMPNKQQVYFELGSAYINAERYPDALSAFRTAYELAPEYREAKVIYLIGAIIAGDRALENRLIAELGPETLASEQRILSAYLRLASKSVEAGRYAEAVAYARRALEVTPAYSRELQELIRQIESGEIR